MRRNQSKHRWIATCCSAISCLTLLSQSASAAIVDVTDSSELQSAIAAASPGDVITLAAGTYPITNTLFCTAAGTVSDPIVVRSATLGSSVLQFDGPLVLFRVSAPHWQFENLEIEGVCGDHSNCEHAFQLAGDADFARIQQSRIRDFNTPIRGNLLGGLFPDDVVVSNVELRNTGARNTLGIVAAIDAIGGRRWTVRDNVIADFGKLGGTTTSHAAVLRGNSRNGIIERNLVICEDLHADGVRRGLSLGGGGTAPDALCDGGICNPEHQDGLIRNNFVINCSDGDGIVLTEASNSGVYNNTLIDAGNIEVRFVATASDIRNNLISGSIALRDGATATQASNLTGLSLATYQSWFVDPIQLDFSLQDGSSIVDQGETVVAVTDDYCANARDDGTPDLGPIEYDAETTGCGPITVVAPTPLPVFGPWAVSALVASLIASLLLSLRPRSHGAVDGTSSDVI